MNKKKGIVLIYDPHNLYQFLWYYCTYGKDIEWTALCLPNSYKGEYLSKECQKLKIFKEIYSNSIPFDSLSLINKINLFLKMLCYAFLGKQKNFAKKILESYIHELDFDTAVILTDVGFVSGLFCLFGDEKEIVILEDGMGDYINRKYSNIFSHFHNFFDVQGFLLSVLGYSNTGHYFPLRTTKYCTKYCSHPDKMLYKNYKTMNVLFDMTYTDVKLFKKFITILYPNIEKNFSEKKDCILFTTPISDYVTDTTKYVTAIEKYVNKNYKSILIKRHPRDADEYNFNSDVKVYEIEQKIPAEVLLPYLSSVEIYFCEISSTNLYMTQFKYNPTFFYFEDLCDDCKKEHNVLARYQNFNEFKNRISFFGFNPKIIEL